ncbi:MAG TPA: hypothetical protein VFJ19_02885 [Nocardioidaceae bacterium]|nr:hypothetical protein [Nocardioidaceae bacterium]
MEDAARATSLADIAGFNEATYAADRRGMLAMLHRKGWRAWFPRQSQRGMSNPIAWDASKFVLRGHRSVGVAEARHGGSPTRFVNLVVLRQRGSGRRVVVLNTHTSTGGCRGGGLRRNDRTLKERRQLATIRGQMLRAERVTPNVVAIGDWNCDYLRDREVRAPGLPSDLLGPNVRFDMPLGDTLTNRHAEIDYVVTPRGPHTWLPVGGNIVTGFHSDHNAVLVGLEYADRPSGQLSATARTRGGGMR